jgi:hypothetical protein
MRRSVVEVVELFLQATFGQHVFQLAPRSFAFFDGVAAGTGAWAALDELVIVLRFFGLGDKFIIDIEMFVVSLHGGYLRLPRKKPGESVTLHRIGIAPATSTGADYIRCGRDFNGDDFFRCKVGNWERH